MEQTIYLIRHGQTNWNKERRFQGIKDINLNETGRKQATQLEEALTHIDFDRVVSSDLSRARETAEILARGRNLEVETDVLLREIHFGDWEGLNFATIEARFPVEARMWLDDPGSLTVPGGESFEAMAQRVWERFLFWTEREDYRKMAIVSHGGTTAAMICKILGEPIASMWQYVQANTAVNVVLRKGFGNYEVHRYNDAEHLQD